MVVLLLRALHTAVRKQKIQQLPMSINGKFFINLSNLHKLHLHFFKEKYFDHLHELQKAV